MNVSAQRKIGIVLNYAYLAINAITSLLYVPILLAIIGASQYGLYQTIGSIVSYLSILGNGLGSTLTRYYAMALESDNGKERCKSVLSVATKVYLLIAVIVLFAGLIVLFNFDFLFGGSFTSTEIEIGRQMMMIVIINTIIALPGSVFVAVINAEERFIFIQILNVIRAIIQPIAVVFIVTLQSTALGIVLAQFFINLLVIAINAAYCIRKLNLVFDFHHNDKDLMVQMLKFTFFVLLGLIFDQILWRTDQIILGVLYGTEMVALYSIGTTLVMAYVMFSNSISSILLPKVSKMIEAGSSMGEISNLFAKVGCLQTIIVSLIETGFLLFGQQFIALWAGKDFLQAYLIVIMFMIGMHLALVQNLGQAILQAKNKQAFKSIVYICIAIANIAITIPASIAFGCIGCAMTSMICLLIGTGPIINLYYKRVIGLDIIYFFKQVTRLLPAIMIPLVSYGCLLFLGVLPNAESWFVLLAEMLSFVIFYALSILIFAPGGLLKDFK